MARSSFVTLDLLCPRYDEFIVLGNCEEFLVSIKVSVLQADIQF